MERKKITIIGAGNVGSQAAFTIAMKNLGDLVLLDVIKGLAQGKALDIQESMPLFNSDSKIIGTNNYEDTKNSDIVVITAGIARKPGMTREELIKINSNIVREVTNNTIKYSKNSILIVVTNPLDVMAYLAYKVSKFHKSKVIGMAGILDSSRFNYFVSEELKESVKNVDCKVIGSHGQGMTILIDNSTVKGKPLSHVLAKEKIDKLKERVIGAGLEIVNYLKTGSAFFSPGASIAAMVESIVKNQQRILPCTVYLDGEYDVRGIFLGVPVKLGKNGVEKIIKLDLSEEEKIQFIKDASNVKEQISKLGI